MLLRYNRLRKPLLSNLHIYCDSIVYNQTPLRRGAECLACESQDSVHKTSALCQVLNDCLQRLLLMSFQDILIEQRGVATWITLNRPEVKNAIRPGTYDELIRAFRQADAAPDTQFIVLTGAGDAFCAGDDVKAVFLAEEAIVGSESQIKFDRYTQKIGSTTPIVETMIHCTKPMIAVINGPAVGMGFDLALLCDIRISTKKSKMASLFVRRGFSGTIASNVILPRIIGQSKAMELILSGETITGIKAEELGIVSTAVEAEDLASTADALIEKLSWGAPLAQRAIKRIARKGMGVDFTFMEEYTRLLSDSLWETEDHNEGVMSHVERRKPEFKSR